MDLSPHQQRLFEAYTRLLIEEGRRANLTSLRDPALIRRRHFGESLALLSALESIEAFASPAIDIGAGAGFPGVPIKIVRPALQLTLLEATGKKADFLRLLVEQLGLKGVRVLHARAEEAANGPEHREAYPLVMARAVAPLPALAELTLPFAGLGGYVALPKGSGARREVAEASRALEICGGEVVHLAPLQTEGSGPAPTLVVLRKVRETPAGYPRRAGIPVKRPL
jgi:16S rRNA (guanine527-N7)-methyltransferase